MSAFSDFLWKEYRRWRDDEEDQGNRGVGQGDWAKFLGVPATSLSQWMGGDRTPTAPENKRKLADTLGLEIYEILGDPIPVDTSDERFVFVAKNWNKIEDNNLKDKIRSMMEEALGKTLRGTNR